MGCLVSRPGGVGNNKLTILPYNNDIESGIRAMKGMGMRNSARKRPQYTGEPCEMKPKHQTTSSSASSSSSSLASTLRNRHHKKPKNVSELRLATPARSSLSLTIDFTESEAPEAPLAPEAPEAPE